MAAVTFGNVHAVRALPLVALDMMFGKIGHRRIDGFGRRDAGTAAYRRYSPARRLRKLHRQIQDPKCCVRFSARIDRVQMKSL